MWLIVGGVGNGVAEADSCWDLNPGAAAMLDIKHTVLGAERGSLDHAT